MYLQRRQEIRVCKFEASPITTDASSALLFHLCSPITTNVRSPIHAPSGFFVI
uniref:Uncharacterized protein n=1 Tax=Nelumbo nucifera TaxID=4432 RepID=A0A822YN19_NELNU|nr:TPA_asm: hypothetical protein HUJ06_011550 [Nelumbo nucifera]